MVRWRDILEDARLRQAHPLLVAAIEHVAHYQIRNRGTVGGSLAHADPAAELPGIAVTCEAEIAVIGQAGERVIKAADFFQGPLMTALRSDEIITEIRFPAWPADAGSASTNLPAAAAILRWPRAAVFYDEDADGKARNTHVGAVGIADRPLRLTAVEQILNGNTSMMRSSPRPKRRQPVRSIRRTTSMPAALIGKGSLASWSSGRYEAPAP